MQANLQITGGLAMAESVMMALAPHVGKADAHAHRRPGRAPGDGRGPVVRRRPGRGSTDRPLARSRRACRRAAARRLPRRVGAVHRPRAGRNRRRGPHMTDVQTTSRGIAWQRGRPAGRARAAAARIAGHDLRDLAAAARAALGALPRHPPRHARARPVGGAGGRVHASTSSAPTRWACSMPPASNGRRSAACRSAA